MKAKWPDLEGITGMALGADQIFAEVCLELGISFVAAIPFRGQENRWPSSSQDTYRSLLGRAKTIVIVDELPKYQSESFGAKMALRNVWMVDESEKAIAVWDGSEGGTGNAVKEILRRGRKLARLDPQTRTISMVSPPDEGLTIFDLFGA
jgi:uncharacterized phage-like protein YoqJ